ncbi:MAG TPA: NUDIX hydrolase [Edaphocola sp.]|nr:NUDIX hydrolase [Edaphocola sp.]
MSYIKKVYFDNKPLIFTDNINDYVNQHGEALTYPEYQGATAVNILSAQKQLNSNDCPGAFIEETNQNNLNAILRVLFTPVTAAGGIVSTPGDKVLLIHRRGVWDLPKGKLDEGESIRECAVREVIEETGLPNDIGLGEEIHRSYHVYSFRGENILKTTYWFAMTVPVEWPLKPQAEEDITEAIWLEKDKLPDILNQTWPTIREVLFLAAGTKP